MEFSGDPRSRPQVAGCKLRREGTQIDRFELVNLPLDFDGDTPSNLHPRIPPKFRFSILEHVAYLQS